MSFIHPGELGFVPALNFIACSHCFMAKTTEEIPLGLEILGKGVEQELSGSTKFSMKRILLSSFLRLAVGYLFLSCLFLVVVQESTVLGIFFDVLALEFVENIDDVLFALFKRGEILSDARICLHSFPDHHRSYHNVITRFK